MSIPCENSFKKQIKYNIYVNLPSSKLRCRGVGWIRVIIIIPNFLFGSRVWVREGDGQSIPVLPLERVLEKNGRFHPKRVRVLHKKDMSDNVFTRE